MKIVIKIEILTKSKHSSNSLSVVYVFVDAAIENGTGPVGNQIPTEFHSMATLFIYRTFNFGALLFL